MSIGIYARSRVAQDRLDFAAKSVAEVFPGPHDDRQTKATIFVRAARWGRQQPDCPDAFHNVEALRVYIRNHWRTIRYMLPKEHNIVPCYVNGPTWGGGGGYRKGNAKLAQKQVKRDVKIADGVAHAANEFAEAAVNIFPRIEAQRRHFVTRQITR